MGTPCRSGSSMLAAHPPPALRTMNSEETLRGIMKNSPPLYVPNAVPGRTGAH